MQALALRFPLIWYKWFLDNSSRQEGFQRGYFGVTLQTLDSDLAEDLGVPGGTTGAVVADVQEGGPAALAGLQSGDVIIEINSQAVRSDVELVNLIGLSQPGTAIPLTVIRDGKRRQIKVTVGDWPEELLAGGGTPLEDGQNTAGFGLTLAPLTEEIRRELEITAERGLLITAVETRSGAQRAGLLPGDVILSVNRQPVRNLNEFKKISRGVDRLVLQVQRGNLVFFASVRKN
jgi:serine protease Do